MMKRFAKWFASIAINLLLLANFSFAQDASGRGTSLGNKAFQTWGNTEAMQSFINALTGSGQHKTMSGNSEFTAAVTCPSSNSFLKLTALPYPSADLGQLFFEQDLDFDGHTDYSYHVPFIVSGVCANGVISCDEGTWDNCRPYKWVADDQRRVSLMATTMSFLSGCYCINNSCGTLLAQNQISSILATLGAGVVDAIQGTNPKYTITGVSVQDQTIIYNGQGMTGCVVAGNSMGEITQTQYAQNPNQMEADATATKNNRTEWPGSFYDSLESIQYRASTGSTIRTCEIQNIAVVSELEETPLYTWHSWLDISIDCFWGVSSILTCGYYFYGAYADSASEWGSTSFTTYDRSYVAPGPIVWIGAQTNGTVIRIDTNDDGVFELTDLDPSGMPWPTNVYLTDWQPVITWLMSKYQAQYSVPFTSIRKQTESSWWTDGGGSGNGGNIQYYRGVIEKISSPVCPSAALGSQYVSTSDKCVIDQVAEYTSDTCSSLAADAACKLKDETVDGVKVIQNYLSTGLVPLSSCKDLIGQLGTHQVCKDWWLKEHVYVCSSDGNYDAVLSDARTRVTNIHDTTTMDANGAGFSYQDLQKNEAGEWETIDGHANIPELPDDAGTCIKACKLKVPKTVTTAGPNSNATEVQLNPSSFDIIYRQCINDLCEVKSNEILDKDCQCINNFAEAATILEALANVGKDVICSALH